MRRQAERELEILSAIGEGRPLTQRALAERLGVALGLTNLYLKRLATKGYIKVTQFPQKPLVGKRLRYLLTPKGMAAKAQLTSLFLNHSLGLYRQTRNVLHEALEPLAAGPARRVTIYGTGEAAELTYLTLRELHLKPDFVVDAEPRTDSFLGLPVRKPSDVAWETIDAVVVAIPDSASVALRVLAGHGFPEDKVIVVGGGGRKVGDRFSS
jgi:DNA-binding MarR family transcriptional regulator